MVSWAVAKGVGDDWYRLLRTSGGGQSGWGHGEAAGMCEGRREGPEGELGSSAGPFEVWLGFTTGGVERLLL